MVTTEPVQQFREQGYFILENLFSSEEIDVLTAHIDRFVEQHEARLKEIGKEVISRVNEISFTNDLAQRDPEIMHFVVQQRFADITTTLLGPDIELYWNQSVYKKPETAREFPWHQDNGYIPTDPMEYVTCWLALNDVSVENGCVWVLPGSHHQGMVKHQPTEIGQQCYFGEDQGVPVELKKGSMVAFSSLLFHRSGPNLSNTIRKGYVIQYSVAGAKHAQTGEVFNRPLVVQNGQPVQEPVIQR